MRKSLTFIFAASLFLLSGCASVITELPELPKPEREIAAVSTPEPTCPEPSAEPSPTAEIPAAIVTTVDWKEAETVDESETQEPEQRVEDDTTVAAISFFEPVIVSSPAPTEVLTVIEYAPPTVEQQAHISTPEPTIDLTPEPTPEPKADFNIEYWISYAQSVAVSKGLNLESSAVDCWDNPITANPDCIYLERDINSRLSRYAGDEEITDVWIWYECVGSDSYLIYFGYA